LLAVAFLGLYMSYRIIRAAAAKGSLTSEARRPLDRRARRQGDRQWPQLIRRTSHSIVPPAHLGHRILAPSGRSPITGSSPSSTASRPATTRCSISRTLLAYEWGRPNSGTRVL